MNMKEAPLLGLLALGLAGCVLESTSASGSSIDRDCWPIKMWIPCRGPSNVTEFEGYIRLEPGCEVSLRVDPIYIDVSVVID